MIIKTINMESFGIAIVEPGRLIKFNNDDTIYIVKSRSVEDGCTTCALEDRPVRCLKICCYYKPIKLEEYVG